MDRNDIEQHVNALDSIMHIDDSEVEFWYARDLMGQMQYSEWRNFSKVIEKARVSCSNAGQPAEAHFRCQT